MTTRRKTRPAAAPPLRMELEELRRTVHELATLLSALGQRVEALEKSPFTINREKYERQLLDLRTGSPGVPMFPG